jgi:hypothetical protein
MMSTEQEVIMQEGNKWLSIMDVTSTSISPDDVDEIVELARRSVEGPPMTPDEIREQRLSFVMGMLPSDSTLTREEVRKQLEAFYG